MTGSEMLREAAPRETARVYGELCSGRMTVAEAHARRTIGPVDELAVKRLREQGQSIAAIAIALGRGRDAVASTVHRLEDAS